MKRKMPQRKQFKKLLYTYYHEPSRFTAEQLRSYGYLDKDIMIEDEEIFQDQFVNLLKNCYFHAPFYDETSNWTYDKHVERVWGGVLKL